VLPEGSSLQRTEAVLEQVRAVVEREPSLASANFYAGRSFGDSSANKGSVFLRLKPIGQRGGGDSSTAAVAQRLNRALGRRISDAMVQLSPPPSVRGFSSEGGLELELLPAVEDGKTDSVGWR